MIVGDTNATKVAMCIGPFQEPPQAEKSAARVQDSVSTENCVTWDRNIDIVWLATLYICSNHTSTGCMWLCISAVYIYSNLQVVSPHLPALHPKNGNKLDGRVWPIPSEYQAPQLVKRLIGSWIMCAPNIGSFRSHGLGPKSFSWSVFVSIINCHKPSILG